MYEMDHNWLFPWEIELLHYSDDTWGLRRLKSPETWFVQVNIKGKIDAVLYWLFLRGIHRVLVDFPTKNQ